MSELLQMAREKSCRSKLGHAMGISARKAKRLTMIPPTTNRNSNCII